MNVEYHRWWSRNLAQDMELKVYGHAGKPVVVFPCQGGRFYEYEDFGMVGACGPFIDSGAITLFTVDSVDAQSWLNDSVHPADRARRHLAYDRYIVDEVAPFVWERTPHASGFLATGCSMGGFHSANVFFRHPDVFDALIALSGVYKLTRFVGDYMDEYIYLNTPLAYLPNLTDPWYLDRYRRSQIVACVGQGAWEDESLADTRQLQAILASKGVPAWIDFWGHDVDHDWPWWRRQMPYFLGHLEL
ncbi:esterase family protein [Candidatus Deferrimicrobium sp.]|uniref:esterase family protein n=1 Tax=Candidatus Deferrimicrobium sp. TaxID=3060586 RepID=UPI003C35C730